MNIPSILKNHADVKALAQPFVDAEGLTTFSKIGVFADSVVGCDFIKTKVMDRVLAIYKRLTEVKSIEIHHGEAKLEESIFIKGKVIEIEGVTLDLSENIKVFRITTQSFDFLAMYPEDSVVEGVLIYPRALYVRIVESGVKATKQLFTCRDTRDGKGFTVKISQAYVGESEIFDTTAEGVDMMYGDSFKYYTWFGNALENIETNS